MYEQVEKPKENISRAVANSVALKKSNGKQGFGFVDNRGKTCVQRVIGGTNGITDATLVVHRNGAAFPAVHFGYTNGDTVATLRASIIARLGVQSSSFRITDIYGTALNDLTVLFNGGQYLAYLNNEVTSFNHEIPPERIGSDTSTPTHPPSGGWPDTPPGLPIQNQWG